MNKTLKKLLPTLALVLVTASLLGTSTFAWFSLNTTATVTGMKLNIETYDNLLVAPDTTDTNALKSNTEASFVNTYTMASDVYSIAPVSSVDGKNFYFNDNRNATAAGNVIKENTYNKYYITADDAATNAGYLTAFRAQYGTAGTAEKVGFVDYNFQLKAINGNTTLANTMDLRLTKLTLQYTGNNAASLFAGGDTSDQSKLLTKSFRVAVFMEAKASTYPTANTDPRITDFSANTAALADAGAKSIYTPTGAANFTSGKAVNAVDGLGEVTYNAITSTAATKEFDTVADESVKYYKVTIRIWLEGEDNTCFNEAYVKLDQDWHLDVAFALVDSAVAENNVDVLTITNNEPALIAYTDDPSEKLTASLVAAYGTADAYQWYKDGAALVGETNAELTTLVDGGKYYCVVTNTLGDKYPTRTYTYTTPAP